MQSGTVTNVPSLLVQTEKITTVPSLQLLPGTASGPPSSSALAPPVLPHLPEMKAEVLATSTMSLPEAQPEAPVAAQATSGQPTGGSVTGTGSVTATPTAYTTAIMTTATTTTSTTIGQTQGSLLGKRIRRQSSKYEDYEQQTVTVGATTNCGEGVDWQPRYPTLHTSSVEIQSFPCPCWAREG